MRLAIRDNVSPETTVYVPAVGVGAGAERTRAQQFEWAARARHRPPAAMTAIRC